MWEISCPRIVIKNWSLTVRSKRCLSALPKVCFSWMKQCSRTMTVCLKDVHPLTADPQRPAAYLNSNGHCVHIQMFTGKSVYLKGKLPQGELPQGEAHTVAIPGCLHYERFKAVLPCLQHLFTCLQHCQKILSPLKTFEEKGLNKMYAN